MNLNVDISSINPTAILRSLRRYQMLAITIAVVALCGFTAYQLSHVVAVPADQAYLSSQQSNVKTPSLKLKPQTVTNLKSLQDPGSSELSVPVGKRSPFSYQDLP